MKVCETLELASPTDEQCLSIIKKMLPNTNNNIQNSINSFSKNDLRKLSLIFNVFKNNKNFDEEVIEKIFQSKTFNEDAKDTTKNLINTDYRLNDHLRIMNETDRTIIGLLWHENIVDVLSKVNKHDSIKIYENILKNICFADYIDRITFQKQIWIFNEMSSLIKTFYNNKYFHDCMKEVKHKINFNPNEVRFTKVLTKYSTEYNNSLFIQTLSQELMIEKKT